MIRSTAVVIEFYFDNEAMTGFEWWASVHHRYVSLGQFLTSSTSHADPGHVLDELAPWIDRWVQASTAEHEEAGQ